MTAPRGELLFENQRVPAVAARCYKTGESLVAGIHLVADVIGEHDC